MQRFWFCVVCTLTALLGSNSLVFGQLQSLMTPRRLNRQLCGRIVAYNCKHGKDRRIPSAILGQKRDLYVYLPPDYNPCRAYPLLLWFHGSFGDEHSFMGTTNLPALDRLIVKGCCPPVIVACADGTYGGRNWITATHSLYTNGRGGRFEDHIMCEVIPFLMCRYRILPQREAHAVAGISSGGGAAMSLALRRRDFFGTVGAISGALNLRYDNCSGDYFEDFCPATYRWKTDYDPREVIGRLLGGLLRLRAGMFIGPVFGSGPDVIKRVARWNPADQIIRTNLRPGELNIFVRYGGKDELNFDAHAESFIWLAGQRGVHVHSEYDPEGEHGLDFFHGSSARLYRWLATKLPGEPASCDCGR